MGAEMETRICACGCGQAFRVMAASKQKFASQSCEALVTPGGYAAVMKASQKKRGQFKPIPENASGQVGTVELAKILGLSYPTLNNWIKAGRITPLPGESRNKTFDLAQVRKQLEKTSGAPPAPAVHEATPHRKPDKIAAPAPEGDESFDAICLMARSRALAAYRQELREQSEAAAGAGDHELGFALLKEYVRAEAGIPGL